MATSNKGKVFPAEPLTRLEVEHLLAACGRGPAGRRNKALIATLYRSGLRISEALALKPSDVDASTRMVNVRRGKGGKQRSVAMDPAAFDYIDAWAAERRRLGIERDKPLFCTISRGAVRTAGEPLETAYIRALLPRLGRKAGITKRVHAHGLRHTHASELVREGEPLNRVQGQLGHGSPGVTSRYIEKIAAPELARTIGRRKWEVETPAARPDP